MLLKAKLLAPKVVQTFFLWGVYIIAVGIYSVAHIVKGESKPWCCHVKCVNDIHGAELTIPACNAADAGTERCLDDCELWPCLAAIRSRLSL